MRAIEEVFVGERGWLSHHDLTILPQWSAFAWLVEKAGSAALESVLSGEVEFEGTLSLQQVVEAVELARETERLQGAQAGDR